MIKQLTVAVLALATVFPSLADVLTVKEDAPKTYVVEKGDTLWDISAIYLDQPWLWPKLWRMNPQIDNPHLIYPGDQLTLVYDAEGRPMLVVNQKFKKLSPKGRKTLKKGDAIPTLPLEVIRPYLTFEQILDADKMDQYPYILGANENVILSTQNHIAYVKGNLERSSYYAMYRKGDPYIDPTDDDKVLGYEAILVGTARAFRSGDIANGEPASVRIVSTEREIRQGDFLMPAIEGQSLPASFLIRRPDEAVAGNIIGSTSKMREFSKLEVVVLNLGSEDNLKAGHMLDIRRQSPTVINGDGKPRYIEDSSSLDKVMASMGDWFDEDQNADSNVWKMPKEKIGEVMIIKTYEQMSYGMIMKTQRPIRVGDNVSVEL